MSTVDTITVTVPSATVEQLEDALDYLDHRLIGETPGVLDHLASALSIALFDAATTEGVVTDLGPHRCRVDDPKRAGSRPPTDIEDLGEIDALTAWDHSTEGQAAAREANRFAVWREQHLPRLQAERAAWLASYAEQFRGDRDAFLAAQRAALRQQYTTGAADGS
ncbi:hypothetical protein [Occultella kanbiaonis]|uniref:hypothetical protein n=1 Tax=Occultella kanbiaonis TaxID=2675754 RepID=UPI0012B7464E|nr:hypothetical protein [Occultella kanbiaonis]